MSEGDNDLLLLTDQGRVRYGLLGQAFANATVVELPDDAVAGHLAMRADANGVGVDFDRAFAAVLVDRSRLDLPWLAALVRDVHERCGRILVALDPGGELLRRDVARFDGVAWGGLETINGRVCAVLHAADPAAGPPAGQVTELFATAHAAVRLSTLAAAEDPTMIGIRDAQRALARRVEERYRSEQALLVELERLATEQDRLQNIMYVKLRRLVGRSWLGRGLRALRRRSRR